MHLDASESILPAEYIRKIDHIREEGEVYDFEWGSGTVCGEVDSHVQPRS